MAHIPFLSHYLERKNIEYQNQLLARQVEEVQNIYLTMRGWRHDYHNHLQSMKAYVEMGQYDKLQEYLGLLHYEEQCSKMISIRSTSSATRGM